MQEEMAEAMALLLETRWVVRAKDPEGYALIRRCETKLKAYFHEKCGWLFVRNARFYKLEKIPALPESWMGVQSFQEMDDYVLLCCTMAYLEEREIEEQFLLSELCEDLLALYPENALHPLRWESYNWRRAFIRTLGFLLEVGVLRAVEDDSEGFLQDRSGEALYEVTLLARYFLRTYPKDLREYNTLEALCQADFLGDDTPAETGRVRRNRVYRQLLLTPVYYQTALWPEDFAYLRNMHRRLREELEERTGLQLDLYRDCAMLTSLERSAWGREIFPHRLSGLHAVVLHFARAYCELEGWRERKRLSLVEFTQFCARLQANCSCGWTKEYREMRADRLAQTVLKEMRAWRMADCDEALQLVTLLPALFRLSGAYPEDYEAEERDDGAQ